ncbi:hypothetical protein [Pararhizobium qamdonense]|uniref:hypothetical protein n=1 Tax=Pararhizobium qamdonense TaxID=3031126 RepID=UPI0023E15FEF|nr:hypothetical protein [Pararhizobium qamdonense]
MTDDVKTGAEEEPARLVDEALAATDRNADRQEGLDAFRADGAGLKASMHEAAADRPVIDDIRQRIRSQPLTFAATLGIFAFIYGFTR